MTLDELRKYYGTLVSAMEVLGLHRTTFHRWTKSGYIPYFQQKRYEKATNGALKADKNLKGSYDKD